MKNRILIRFVDRQTGKSRNFTIRTNNDVHGIAAIVTDTLKGMKVEN